MIVRAGRSGLGMIRGRMFRITGIKPLEVTQPKFNSDHLTVGQDGFRAHFASRILKS